MTVGTEVVGPEATGEPPRAHLTLSPTNQLYEKRRFQPTEVLKDEKLLPHLVAVRAGSRRFRPHVEQHCAGQTEGEPPLLRSLRQSVCQADGVSSACNTCIGKLWAASWENGRGRRPTAESGRGRQTFTMRRSVLMPQRSMPQLQKKKMPQQRSIRSN